MRPDMEATIELAKVLKKAMRFSQFQRDTEYVALVNDSEEYPFLSGDVGSTDGVRMNKKDYKKITNEFIVPHSTAKHCKLSRESYAVGALARFNLNAHKLHKKAKDVVSMLGLKPVINNPYLNSIAQLLECVHCLEDSIEIIEGFKKSGINYNEQVVVGLNENKAIKVKAGNGVGAVEVPRGILFHNYEVDENGIILKANCIIPTGQNCNNIEQDMKKLVPEIMHLTEEEITLELEVLVRAYDPCISCSAHFLDVKFVK
jgi:coenzyme F420-reducing hydrogenase alpha subunit